MPNDTLPDWERVLAAAAHLQRILPGAILVGGSAAALYAGHRLSTDADHVLSDLRERFDQVLADLEAVAGWKTARIKRPVQILGSLDGGNDVAVEVDREQQRIIITPLGSSLPDVDEEFGRQVAEFIKQYRPALEALARR